MARTKSPNHELQREEILDRAAEAFAAKSYPGTSMNDLANACGTSKARLYHYYASKDAILFDLLDRYTQHLIDLATQEADTTYQAPAAQNLRRLIHVFLSSYEHSQTRHIALLNDVKFLAEPQRTKILDAQRTVVALFARTIAAAYPDRTNSQNQAALTMLLFGMINWTFTWLKPGDGQNGKLTYTDFAAMVETVFTRGVSGLPVAE